MISYVNSFPRIQSWFHKILHSTEFTHEFMIMNSYMISLSWIHQHEFRDEFIHMNSDMISRYSSWSWIICEFILWIHIRFHDHEFICYISWPMTRNSYMNLCIWISWNHTWNHVYQGSRWPTGGFRAGKTGPRSCQAQGLRAQVVPFFAHWRSTLGAEASLGAQLEAFPGDDGAPAAMDW